MIWDVHVHVAGVERRNGNFLSPRFRRSLACRLFLRRLGLGANALNADDGDEQIARFIVNQVNASCVDRAVLLAFDAAYREDGTRDEERTLMVADNDFVAGLAATSGKILFGASVHPYRHDALAALERLIESGACLVKWLPSAQNIQPDHPRCFPFYDLLAKHKVPLLSHTGGEHTLKAFPDSLSDPRRLVPALDRGVTVIAAHCGTSLFLHENLISACGRKWLCATKIFLATSARLASSPESGGWEHCFVPLNWRRNVCLDRISRCRLGL